MRSSVGYVDTVMRRYEHVRRLSTRSAGLLRHSALVETMIDDNLSWMPCTQLADLTRLEEVAPWDHRRPPASS